MLVRVYYISEKTIPRCHICAVSNLKHVERTELQSRMKGICQILTGVRHFSPSLPLQEARYLKAESDLRAEISGSIVKV